MPARKVSPLAPGSIHNRLADSGLAFAHISDTTDADSNSPARETYRHPQAKAGERLQMPGRVFDDQNLSKFLDK